MRASDFIPVLNQRDFIVACERLAKEGKCDSWPSEEANRIYDKWVECNKPAPLEKFILDRAAQPRSDDECLESVASVQ